MPVINKPNQHFDATLYTGAGGTQTVSGLQFQPDFIWGKARSAAYGSALFDSVRGYGSAKGLVSNLTQAEGTVSAQYGFVSAATSTGFTAAAGTDGSNPNAALNESGVTYVAWNWKAGGTAVTNTAGSITSQVSANPTAGFSIVTYTGNGTGGATVGHGLGATPSMVIVKKRSGVADWPVQHISLGPNASLRLNGTNATANEPWWNSTAPSSTVFTLGNSNTINQSGETFVAYCFAPVAGYSAFGSYTGNGSTDGPFVFTNFRPRFVMFKNTTTGSTNWQINDSSRDTFNVMNKRLAPSNSDAEATDYNFGDFLSNGFKIRQTDQTWNKSGDTYIYMAFAEAPFKFSTAR
jgi:hypothetical protein